MSADALAILRNFFSNCWKFFNGWYVPGTNVTIGAALLLLFVSGIVLKMILSIIRGSPAEVGSNIKSFSRYNDYKQSKTDWTSNW